ncbi:MAG: Serine/threonine protein kinase PrkC, regulator of stationary phase, partial [Thermoleophilia bacterium]|nr:Serine/threonine protein kinase PrkC, regulator of stationary phase [Thermoleophilia bacterium]
TGRRARRQRPARSDRTPSETRARILAWSMVAAPLIALVIFGIMISGERGNEQVKGKAGDSGGPLRVAQVVGAVSFDPDGDGIEHPDSVANILDSDPKTTWETEGYDTGDFNLRAKQGVGIVLQLDDPAEVREIAIATRLPGWTVEVRTSDNPATKLDGWTRVSKAVPVENGARIPVDLDGTDTTHLLLWITQLVIDYDDPNRYRARIGDLKVYVADAAATPARGE